MGTDVKACQAKGKIVTLSLVGACTMSFRTDSRKGSCQTVRVHLPPRTLQVWPMAEPSPDDVLNNSTLLRCAGADRQGAIQLHRTVIVRASWGVGARTYYRGGIARDWLAWKGWAPARTHFCFPRAPFEAA